MIVRLIYLGYLISTLVVICWGQEERHCFVCSGDLCMEHPAHPSLSPGRVRCHDSMHYCATHVRYVPTNLTATYAPVPFENGDIDLSPSSYEATSVTRSCAKIYLGNTCRRDFLGAPLITCITTCDKDYCNCDTRSPPPEMFEDGKPLPVAPNTSSYPAQDMDVCRKLAVRRKQLLAERQKEAALSGNRDSKKGTMTKTSVKGPKKLGYMRNSASRRSGNVFDILKTGLIFLTFLAAL